MHSTISDLLIYATDGWAEVLRKTTPPQCGVSGQNFPWGEVVHMEVGDGRITSHLFSVIERFHTKAEIAQMCEDPNTPTDTLVALVVGVGGLRIQARTMSSARTRVYRAVAAFDDEFPKRVTRAAFRIVW